MTTFRKILLSGVVLSLGATGFAFAQQGAPDTSPPAASQPADEGVDRAPGADREARRAERRDRSVSAEDFGADRMARLSEADTDGDGELSRAEIEAYVLQQIVQRQADRMERRLDIDGDGTVTLAEIENHDAKRFAVLDRNEDGRLNRSELRHARQFAGEGRWHRGEGQHARTHREEPRRMR